MAANDDITLSRIRDALHYNPETGALTWVKPSGRRVRPGTEAGNDRPDGYREVRVCGQRFLVHRLIWLMHYGVMPVDQIDHINGNRSDNRICNLREADVSRNSMNSKRRSDNSSGIKGVSFDKSRSKWAAYININGRRKAIGRFDSKKLAGATVSAYRKELHKEFARYA